MTKFVYRVLGCKELGSTSAKFWPVVLEGLKLFSARKQENKKQVAVVIMSNNNASNNLIVAQRAVKQLRLEASIRRIKVRTSRRRHTNTEERGDTRLNGGEQQRHRANFVVFKKF